MLPTDVHLAYYSKPSDSLVTRTLEQLLQRRGFTVSRPPYTRSERSDAVWCGSDVPDADCVLVALRMVQTGLTVRQVFRFPKNHKERVVEIGHNDNLAQLDPLRVSSLLALTHSGIPIDATPP